MIQPSWKAYFIFSNKEIKGIIVLGFVLLGSVSIRYFFPSKQQNIKDKNGVIDNPAILHLVQFDPNTIDSLQAIQMGIPAKQVSNLMHYRSKGGYFKSKEDFGKLYGLSPTLFNQLSSYIVISKQEKQNSNKTPWQNYKLGQYQGAKEEIWKIDINTASEEEWKQKTALPSILIQRILGYKKYRGAFTKTSELAKIYGITDVVFQNLKVHLELNKNSTYKLNAKAMSFSDWKALGLFTDPQIWKILRFKKENGGGLNWEMLVTALDLTQGEGQQLKDRVRFEE